MQLSQLGHANYAFALANVAGLSFFFLSNAHILEYLGLVIIYFGFLEMTGRGRGQGPGSGRGQTEARGIEAGSITIGASQIHKL